MSRDWGFWGIMLLILLFVVGMAAVSIADANKCADKGGVYITSKGTGGFPACLKGVESL